MTTTPAGNMAPRPRVVETAGKAFVWHARCCRERDCEFRTRADWAAIEHERLTGHEMAGPR